MNANKDNVTTAKVIQLAILGVAALFMAMVTLKYEKRTNTPKIQMDSVQTIILGNDTILIDSNFNVINK